MQEIRIGEKILSWVDARGGEVKRNEKRKGSKKVAGLAASG